MKLKFIAAAFSLGFGLMGCQAIQTAETLSTVTVSPAQIVVATDLFIAAEKTATNYLRLPPCPTTGLCRDPAAVAVIDKPLRAGYPAVKQLLAYAKTPIGPAPVSAYNVTVTAVDALNSAFAQYDISKGQ